MGRRTLPGQDQPMRIRTYTFVSLAGVRVDIQSLTPGHASTGDDGLHCARVGGAHGSGGITGDVHVVGGPKTVGAFREIGALLEIGLVTVPFIQGDGLPLAAAGIEPWSLTLRATRSFPDGAIEASYTPQSRDS